ncbi:MAG: hypothetical protein JGK03_30365 [Microcoleus sp. PH2017_25_DOB_D_A]|uniref:hypothetical protein n=1 Tax=unclassified Microcoleus TaxID=2642155 RepID=UPI001D673ECD|nr:MULTISPECIES: hypothetical protein [unclassified Microcoleus]MCC3412328.1 hypothetical protein [Microcoleus sp. PH2017_02_FOX_O_A]MCC3442706.1 hypothetical protein [Microcoleus sp. PH2017_03_ELD_O_A]MCC3467068.1 hypothetical protein [Microcoleus sp. PH2017_06_SFM_O_A]MCC3538393.1 hypothetical protein [Microcoleus sp. PH2017_25_DOB_D_A]MCC3494661.1 hypothetical protein [Microcoleus sp. PH2017_16_JOR_D_A]
MFRHLLSVFAMLVTQLKLDLKLGIGDRELGLGIVSMRVRSTVFYLKSPFKT